MAAAWSARMALAHPSAVLIPLDGLDGTNPAFLVVWSRFPTVRRYLAQKPGENVQTYSFSRVCWAMVPFTCFLSVAKIGFVRNSDERGWSRPGLGTLPLLSSP